MTVFDRLLATLRLNFERGWLFLASAGVVFCFVKCSSSNITCTERDLQKEHFSACVCGSLKASIAFERDTRRKVSLQKGPSINSVTRDWHLSKRNYHVHTLHAPFSHRFWHMMLFADVHVFSVFFLGSRHETGLLFTSIFD